MALDRASLLSTLLAALGTRDLGREAFCFDTLPSTQTTATALARAGVGHGALVYAARQTAGRGRHGRSWLSGGPDESLCFSVVLSRGIVAETAFHWSFVAALAFARALDLGIKWPNDLYLARKKVGGILATLETEPRPAVILGLGLNLRFVPDAVAAPHAGALRAHADTPAETLGRLLRALEDGHHSYLSDGPRALAQGVRGRLALGGEKVQVSTQSGIVEGVLQSIDDDFQLVLEVEGKARKIVSTAEVWPVEGA